MSLYLDERPLLDRAAARVVGERAAERALDVYAPLVALSDRALWRERAARAERREQRADVRVVELGIVWKWSAARRWSSRSCRGGAPFRPADAA